MTDTEKELNLVIPEDMKEFYITGSAIASTPYNIRLILFNEELEKSNDILDTSKVNLIRTAKAEIIMPPAVAKQIYELIGDELSKHTSKK